MQINILSYILIICNIKLDFFLRNVISFIIINAEKETAMKAKKDKKKIFKKILIGLLITVAALAALTAIVNTVLYNLNMKRVNEYSAVVNPDAVLPVLEENGEYAFITDRELKIVTLTDVHIGGGWMSFSKDRMAFNTVASLVTCEKPDLVVITGDLAYPVPFQSGTFNNKLSAKLIIALMENLGVPYTVTFGNHDTESYSFFSRKTIGELYSDPSLEHSLFSVGPEDVDGVGNHVIHVKNTKGEFVQELVFIDSHSYTDGDIFGIFWKYDNVQQSQVDWYEQKIKAAQAVTPDVKSLVFLHIPLVEYRDAYYDYLENGCKDTENTKYVSGIIGEKDPYVYCGMHEDNLFEKILELGSTKAVFCGHDHLNNIVLNYKGVDLTYNYSIDYLAYIGISKKGDQRGCTVVTVNPDGSYEQVHENYYQDKYVSLYPKENVTFVNK